MDPQGILFSVNLLLDKRLDRFSLHEMEESAVHLIRIKFLWKILFKLAITMNEGFKLRVPGFLSAHDASFHNKRFEKPFS